VAGFREHGNEHSGSIDCGEFGKEQRDIGSSGTVDCRILRLSPCGWFRQLLSQNSSSITVTDVSNTYCWPS